MLTALVLVTVLSGQTAPPATSAMPVITGATASPDCGGIRELIAGGDRPMQCITAPLEQIGGIARAYAAEAARNGWIPLRADNNVMWMQQAGANDMCERLTIIGFWDSARYPEPRTGVPGYLGVMLESGLACETPTPVATAQ